MFLLISFISAAWARGTEGNIFCCYAVLLLLARYTKSSSWYKNDPKCRSRSWCCKLHSFNRDPNKGWANKLLKFDLLIILILIGTIKSHLRNERHLVLCLTFKKWEALRLNKVANFLPKWRVFYPNVKALFFK